MIPVGGIVHISTMDPPAKADKRGDPLLSEILYTTKGRLCRSTERWRFKGTPN